VVLPDVARRPDVADRSDEFDPAQPRDAFLAERPAGSDMVWVGPDEPETSDLLAARRPVLAGRQRLLELLQS